MHKAVLTLVVLTLLSPSAIASQCPAHFHVALKAFREAPEPVKRLLAANLSAYLAGSTGTDIAQTAYVSEAFEWPHPGSPAHAGGYTGDIIVAMLREAQKLPDAAARDQATAFALGWLTHHATDCYIHPLCNEFGGNYGEDSRHTKRHKHLELVECPHVFTTGDYRVLTAFLDPQTVPLLVINSAFASVSSDLAYYVGDFVLTLERSRLIMSGVVNWMSSNHIGVPYSGTNSGELMKRLYSLMPKLFPLELVGEIGPDPTFAFSTALKGTPPKPSQYEKLMKPLVIDKVDWDFPDDLKGNGKLRIAYTVNDAHLFKLFCQQWDVRIEYAIRDSVSYFKSWVQNPAGFSVPNTNLNTGLTEGKKYSPKDGDPGDPDINKMLGSLSIHNDKGQEISPWPADGQWVEIDFSKGNKVWEDYVSGGGQFEITFDPGVSQFYDVELSLGFADDNKRLYGWPEKGQVIKAEWKDRLQRILPKGEIEIVNAECTKQVELGQPADLWLEYKVNNIADPKVEVTEKVEVISDELRSPLNFGPRKTIVYPDDRATGVIKTHYQVRLAKPGFYSWSIDLEAQGYKAPEGRSLTFLVKAKQEGGRWVLSEEESKVEESQGEFPTIWEGKETGKYRWSSKGFKTEASLKVNHGDNVFTNYECSGEISPPPPRELTPGERIEFTVEFKANANTDSYNKDSRSEGALNMHRFENVQGTGHTGTVGWVNCPECRFVPYGKGSIAGTVPPGREGDKIAIVGRLSPGVQTSKNFYFEYVYRWKPKL